MEHMPESEVPSSFDLRLLPDSHKDTGSRETFLSFRGLLWGIFFEAVAVLILAMAWRLWSLFWHFLS